MERKVLAAIIRLQIKSPNNLTEVSQLVLKRHKKLSCTLEKNKQIYLCFFSTRMAMF